MARPSKITEESVQLTEVLLAQRVHKCTIKAALEKQFSMSARTSERVLARARERLLARTNKPKDEHRVEAYAFYDQILRNTSIAPIVKIRAQERIDKLFGLEAPERMEHTGKVQVGPQIDYSKLTTEQLRTLETILSSSQPDEMPEGTGRAEPA